MECALAGQLAAVCANEEFALFGNAGRGRFGRLCASRCGGLRLLRGVLFIAGSGERLRAFRVVAIDGHGLHAQLPGLNIRLHDVFDRGIFGHVDGLADSAGEKGLGRRHHFQVAAPGDGTPADGCERAIENRQGARA